ncbi:phosphatase [Halolactibacillus miurensis]|uniref:Phosphatase n=1 Tax=Halolactibacillus miurensis TaxID=306541 RepID=A0A1I6R3L8_9BACI|nr:MULTISPECIES: HAD family hydrolase [Halolactibacillus]GEM03613.1 phosphatase [Halolactibacillus miurensis]SFS59150.1 hypothetical protein SAMN05421668_10574 [Halolactibacillus miurensis]
MTQITHLFIDVDGTIVRHDQSIHSKTIAALKAAKAKGVELWLATGRPVHELKPLMDTLGITNVVGYNGAYARKGDRVLYEQHMNEQVVDDLIQTAQAHNQEIVLYSDTHNLFTSFEPDFVQTFIQHFGIVYNALYTDDQKSHIYGMTLMNCPKDNIYLYQKDETLFFSEVHVEGMTNHYDIIQQAVNKGKAIEAIVKQEGLNMEQVAAIGDGMNDKDMLKLAGTGIAMGNAHPDLIAYSDYQTTSVDEGGLYDAFIHLGIIESSS